jgi:acetate kinase
MKRILSVNAGSSSVKFALYEAGKNLSRKLEGELERVGMSGLMLRVNGEPVPVKSAEPSECIAAVLLDSIAMHLDGLIAVGHRVVHGGAKYSSPRLIDHRMMAELHQLVPFDLEHLPSEIALIKAFLERYPKLTQVACFDTAFHCSMPRISQILAIPRRYEAMGIQRYGFHGLSYTYLMQELERLGDTAAQSGRVILAHLGSGASMSAVSKGKPLDTSMGFSPSSGLMMSTRVGDIDPGVAVYLMQGMTAEQFNRLVNHESGLLGISETSPDMRDLLNIEQSDVRAKEAVSLFCYQAKKCIGSYAAALNGLDTLVFSGGIGENAPSVRAQICSGLDFLGIEIDNKRNADNESVISTSSSAVTVRVMHTDEELMIAKSVCDVLGLQKENDRG